MIIIGLGSGRCGTRSLASLLNAQSDTVCFHEVNPSCMAWTGTERTVLSMLEEFRAVLAGGPRQITVDLATRRRAEQLPRLRSLEVVRAIGDVAFYYLPYAPMLAEMPDVRMPVLRRDKDATVASFVQVMRIRRGRIRTVIDGVAALLRRRPYRRYRNHWVEHDGRRWRRSVKFDKCFPKFKAESLEDALGQYWDLYYRTAEELAAKYPDEDPDLRSRRSEHAIGTARHLGILRVARSRSFVPSTPTSTGGRGTRCWREGHRCRMNGSRGRDDDEPGHRAPACARTAGAHRRHSAPERSAPSDAVFARSERPRRAKHGRRSPLLGAPGKGMVGALACRRLPDPGSGSDREGRSLHLHLQAPAGAPKVA